MQDSLLGRPFSWNSRHQPHVTPCHREADEQLLASLDPRHIFGPQPLVRVGLQQTPHIVAHPTRQAQSPDHVQDDPPELLAQLVQPLVRPDQPHTHRPGARPHPFRIVRPLALHEHLHLVHDQRPIPPLLRIALRLLLERRTHQALEDHRRPVGRVRVANALGDELDDQDPLLADQRPKVDRRLRLAEQALTHLGADQHVDAPLQALDRRPDLLRHLWHLHEPVVADVPVGDPVEHHPTVGRSDQEALKVQQRRRFFPFEHRTDAHQQRLLHPDRPGPDLRLDASEDLAQLASHDISRLRPDDPPVEGVDARYRRRRRVDHDDPVVRLWGQDAQQPVSQVALGVNHPAATADPGNLDDHGLDQATLPTPRPAHGVPSLAQIAQRRADQGQGTAPRAGVGEAEATRTEGHRRSWTRGHQALRGTLRLIGIEERRFRGRERAGRLPGKRAIPFCRRHVPEGGKLVGGEDGALPTRGQHTEPGGAGPDRVVRVAP